MMTITQISAQRGTRVSTPRPRAGYCALVPSTVVTAATSVVASFGDQKWAGVRLDGHTAMGPSAWSPPI